MAILITGGAGYIGGVTAAVLDRAGERFVVLDDLSRSCAKAVPDGAVFVRGNVGDRELIARIVQRYDIDCCLHFAAYAYVGESTRNPGLYYRNNLAQGLQMLGALNDCGVRNVVFSSSCSVYGTPCSVPVSEAAPICPESPYAWTKAMFEQALTDCGRAGRLRYVALRYFNAAGALPGRGEAQQPAARLIPIAFEAATGKRPCLDVYGTDYPTADGTAVRDYVHVEDLANAHLLAAGYLREGGESVSLNLGTGTGHSVHDIIDAVQRVSGLEVPVRLAPRRAGDPARLYADSTRAQHVLGWRPRWCDLDGIVESAWAWYRAPRFLMPGIAAP